MNLRRFLLSLLFLCVGARAATLGPWIQRTSPVAEGLKAVVDGPFGMLAGGANGVVVRSDDGQNWAHRITFTGFDIYGLAYGNGRYVAAASAGRFIRTADMQSFLFSPQVPYTTWLSITFADGKFVAGGTGGKIAVSTDGETWQVYTLPNYTGAIRGVAPGFVAVGDNAAVFTSPDGVTWTQRALGAAQTRLWAAARGPGGYVISGDQPSDLYTSPDGIAWTMRFAGGSVDVNGITWGGDRFLAVGDNGRTVWAPSISSGWTQLPNAPRTLRSVTHLPDSFIAVGDGGLIVERYYTDATGFVFLQQPQDVAAMVGDQIYLRARAMSAEPVDYQWFKGNFAIPAATTGGLRFQATDESVGGTYRLRATSGGQTIFTRDITVQVVSRPVVSIVAPTANSMVPAGQVRIAATATSDVPITSVAFFRGESELGRATAEPFEIRPTLEVGEYTIRAVAMNTRGHSSTSAPVTFRVEFATPTFLLQPLSQSAPIGATVYFRVEAAGVGGLRYSWLKDGQPIEGASLPELRVDIANADQAGEYRAVAQNDFDRAESQPAMLTVVQDVPDFENEFWHPLPTRPGYGDYYTTMAAGSGIILAGGPGGRISASKDGATWHDAPAPITSDIKRIRFLNGRFWATASRGEVLSSADGLTWRFEAQAVAGDLTIELNDIAALGDTIVAVGALNFAFTYNPSRGWRLISAGSGWDGSEGRLVGIAAGNGRFVAVGDSHWSGNNRTFISVDGETWTEELVRTERNLSVSFFAGSFVRTTDQAVFSSSDGVTWTSRLQGQFSASFETPTRLFLLGGLIAWTENGIDFTTAPNNGSGTEGAYFNSFYFSAGLGISASLNGVDWSSLAPALFNANLQHASTVNFADGRFYIGGGVPARTVVSNGADGWTRPINAPGAGIVSGVSFGAGRYVATTETGAVWTSTDGINFTLRPTGIGSTVYSTYEDGEFLAVGSSYVYRSTDGLTWTSASWPGMSFYSVTKANGIALAVGTAPGVFRSENGGPWEQVATGVNHMLHGVAFGAGRFVALGLQAALHSADGLRWTRGQAPIEMTEPVGLPAAFRRVKFADGMFLAGATQGRVAYSWDGINWFSTKLHTASELHSVAFGNGRWVLTGPGGALMQTGARPGATAPTIAIDAAAGSVALTVSAPAGQLITIEQNETLAPDGWEIFAREISDGSPMRRTISGEQAQIFFRAVSE